MFRRQVGLAIPIVLMGVISFSTTAASDCEDVYKSSTRNYSFAEHDWASLNSVFDAHCLRTGERKKFRWDSSMGVVIEGLPVNMTGNAQADLDKMSNFCHNYSSLRYEKGRQEAGTSTVVVEALSNFNACKEIEAEAGVTIAHQFADPNAVVVNFNFRGGGTRVMSVQGVVTSPNLSCRSNRAKSAGKGDIVNAQTRFEERNNFTILCTRAGQKTTKGTVEFAPGALAIATNIASYAISMPSDSVYSNELASNATARINELHASNTALTKEREALQALKQRVDNLKVEVHSVITGNPHPGGGGILIPCGQTVDSKVQELCAGAIRYSATPITSDQGGGQCGYQRFAITCVRY